MQTRDLSLKIIGYGMAAIYGLGAAVYLWAQIGAFLWPEQTAQSRFFAENFSSLEASLRWVLFLPHFIGFIGVLRLKEWGREIVILVSAASVLLECGLALISLTLNVLPLGAVVVNLMLIRYFMQPDIRNQFLFSVTPTGKTILVIDDDRGFLKLIRSFLVSRGHRALLAENGEKGIKIAGTSKPDLILLDVIMPGMKGREVCAKLKSDEQTKEIPVIFLTAKDSPDDIKAEMELGALTHITKPLDAKELYSKIAGILDA